MRLLILSFLAVMLSSCASNNASIAPLAPLPKITTDNPATIAFIRRDFFSGGAVTSSVSINGTDIGIMKNENILIAEVNPGKYEIKLTATDSTSTHNKIINIKGGEKKLFWLKPNFPIGPVCLVPLCLPLAGAARSEHDYFLLEEVPFEEIRKNTKSYSTSYAAVEK